MSKLLRVIAVLSMTLVLTACGTVTYEGQYEKGANYLQGGQYEKAVTAFTAAIATDDTHAEAYERRGEAYSALAISPPQALQDLTLPEGQHDISDYCRAQAQADFASSIARDPHLSDAYLNSAKLMISLGDYQAAQDMAQQGVDQAEDPQFMEKWDAMLAKVMPDAGSAVWQTLPIYAYDKLYYMQNCGAWCAKRDGKYGVLQADFSQMSDFVFDDYASCDICQAFYLSEFDNGVTLQIDADGGMTYTPHPGHGIFGNLLYDPQTGIVYYEDCFLVPMFHLEKAVVYVVEEAHVEDESNYEATGLFALYKSGAPLTAFCFTRLETNAVWTQTLDGFEEYFTAEKDGKTGVIDRSGAVVVPFLYEDADLVYGNRIAVKWDGQWGMLSLAEKQYTAEEMHEKYIDRAMQLDDDYNYEKDDWYSQAEMNEGSSAYYDAWNQLMDEVYAYLSDSSSDAERGKLAQEQESWLQQREQEIDEAGKRVEGGSALPLARLTAGIQCTQKRVCLLIGRIG